MIENYSLSTVKTTLSPIVSIYKYYEIEIVELPRMNIKGIKTPEPIVFKDLPDKTIIRKALSISNPRMSAIIYFMVYILFIHYLRTINIFILKLDYFSFLI